MKSRSAISPLQLRHAAIKRAMTDQPKAHEARYLAEGSRWTR